MSTTAPATAATATRHRPAPRWLWLIAAYAALAVAVLLSLALGARDIPFGTVLDALLHPHPTTTDHTVVLDLRLPRTLIGVLAGAALAVAGTLMQGLTRNPLADPGLLGINAGASLCVLIAISVFGITQPAGFVWFAFTGAALAAVVVYAVGSLGRGGATPLTLALAGAALTAGLTSLIMLVLLTDLGTFDSYRFWSVGSLSGRDLTTAATLLPFILAGILLALTTGRMLNTLSLGDDIARGLGQNVTLTRVLVATAVVLLCGSATALAGPIVFVGLVVPHIIRPLSGPDHRWLIAYSLPLGPVLLLAADILGRVIARPGEIEAGLVVAFLGAPVMIALLQRRRLTSL
ncbi:iron chelate uptake ABC transporter family permease subunit [Klugiella xanthotipulae]|uniref:Iron complex transport system permease protein n=1 Tax=Klugiella xanthotipulae TaxID=244735 RepID=A0A543HZ70_9MICO|nr:iron chelate uptake ABC transporter family permease subunit [Klugiella xanthotipulae]TQM63619.1 iron complex transport system permease protein [Klugiella xanthotipulae]